MWVQAGIVIIYGSNVDAAPHSHHAMQVIWPQHKSLCKLNGNHSTELLIIDSKVEHQLQMAEGWVLLIEPKSHLGQELFTKLAGKSFRAFSSSTACVIKPQAGTEDVTTLLAPLFKELALKNKFLVTNESTVKDKRIQQVLSELNRCLSSDCIKPSSWRASQVASQIALSESRFLHLFSEELGITWRPYLLWRRMMCAIQALINNTSATEAAHLAGFSDSAHLSRTFRKTFGMTIRQSITLFIKDS